PAARRTSAVVAANAARRPEDLSCRMGSPRMTPKVSAPFPKADHSSDFVDGQCLGPEAIGTTLLHHSGIGAGNADERRPRRRTGRQGAQRHLQKVSSGMIMSLLSGRVADL